MIKFFNTEAQLNIAQIEEIETYAGLHFPEEYTQHFLQYNGGQCEPNIFSFYENGQLTDSNVDWFLAIYDGEDDNLKDYLYTYKIDEKRLPTRIFPIAHDPGGNLICIDTANGKVYFWDHEKEVDYTVSDDSDYSNLYLIANSFNEFLSGLRDDE
jgi:cell wall assembly regulator SMI1